MDDLICLDCGCEFEGWFPDNCTCPRCGSDDASLDDYSEYEPDDIRDVIYEK